MAALETSVIGPLGPIIDLRGRVAHGEAVRMAVDLLESRIATDKMQLAALLYTEDVNVRVVTHRGSAPARSYEEMRDA